MISIIWDLDGTLIDSYPYIVKAVKEVSDKYKLNYSEKFIFNYLKEYTSTVLFQRMAKDTNIDIDILGEEFRSNFFKDESKIKLVEHTKEILDYFKDNQINNYIYTHKGITTHDVLKNNGIEDYFIEVITNENNFKMKPDPEALDYLMEKYSLDRNSTYLIGDRFLDVDCARNGSIKSVFYNPLGLVCDRADYNIRDLIELKKIIK